MINWIRGILQGWDDKLASMQKENTAYHLRKHKDAIWRIMIDDPNRCEDYYDEYLAVHQGVEHYLQKSGHYMRLE